MERIRALNGYQKGVLVAMLAMIVIFTILYSITISRVGYLYEDTILTPSQVDGAMVYSGKVWGKQTSFTVSADKSVIFQYGGLTYGPYTMTKDPTAVPEDDINADRMTGIELRRGEDVFFRGGVLGEGKDKWLFREDGGLEGIGIISWVEDGTTEPSAYNILDLIEGPELVHKGSWMGWFFGVVVCAFTAILILFADELFRFNLRFSIRNVEDAEPSEWEIMSRYVAWTVLPVMALVLFIAGLH